MLINKAEEIQPIKTRRPRQKRALEKVELMLEAAARILEKDGRKGLTTNVIAAKAGVSIGTLYQYFPNKEAILDALANQELAGLSARVIAVMQDAAILSTEKRIAAVVRAFAASYGQRHKAHRLVMAHSLSRGGNRLAPLWSRLQAYLSTERPSGAITAPLDPADAFVLTHAFAGVFRAMISEKENAPSQTEIERSLTRLVIGFLA